jgi:hypothetical protein
LIEVWGWGSTTARIVSITWRSFTDDDSDSTP